MSSFDEKLFSKPVMLATGVGKWSLLGASTAYAQLQSALASEEHRPFLADLRAVCLGVPGLSKEQIQNAKKIDNAPSDEKDTDSVVTPLMRDVVLASLRGEGNNLFLVSPFTDEADRELSDFLNARDAIRIRYSVQEAETILASKYPLTDDAIKGLAELHGVTGQWKDKITETPKRPRIQE